MVLATFFIYPALNLRPRVAIAATSDLHSLQSLLSNISLQPNVLDKHMIRGSTCSELSASLPRPSIVLLSPT